MINGHFREIVESAGVGILVTDLETGVITSANPSAEKLLDVTRMELEGSDFSEFLVDERPTGAIRRIGTFSPGNTEVFLKVGRCRPAPFLMTDASFEALGKSYIVRCFVNIEEHAIAEEAMGHAKEQLKTWLYREQLRNREITTLNALGETLQVNRILGDALQGVGRLLPALFPGSSGSIALLRESNGHAESLAKWGAKAPRQAEYSPDACIALSTKAHHVCGEGFPGNPCPHAGTGRDSPFLSICVPMLPHGDLLGALHLAFTKESLRTARELANTPESLLKLATNVAGHLGLALSNIRLREDLRHQAIRDPLTGLFNRRYMEETFRREVFQARRGGKRIGVIMIDIDHFKKFNDSFGHAAGDAVLKAMGEFLASSIRGGDVPCRYGGEEFILILIDSTAEGTARRAEQIRKEACGLQVVPQAGPLPPITVSLGVAAFPIDGETPDDVIRAADAALYEAKARGRNRVVLAGEK